MCLCLVKSEGIIEKLEKDIYKHLQQLELLQRVTKHTKINL